ncbi:CNNM domain-containing protein [Massilia sp. DJPM01]|uniref:CNNM domain-containing protein n=1 Tax=Massilia sp. DJPM01 TaxID=3024404 RepID=UPI00259FC4D3|nr:CNNM domain-containing protein [Massilia sp. DJPM01]MDM5176449.1 CNNM domain-containing protein [Massilia sp. DJPM01]
MDLLIILVLILLNGVFAMSELALESSKRVRLEKMAAEGRGGARAAMRPADDPGAFLSTVQVGITVISTFNGAFGEASLTARLAPQLAAVPVLAPHARQVALAPVVAGITLVSMLQGELVPKRIAIQYPECVASLIAPPLQALSRAMAPFVRLREVLGIGQALPGEASGAYQTLAGFVLEQLGRVPAASDRFVWERYRFEVVDMDRHRIERVLVAELGEAGGGVDGLLAGLSGPRACRRRRCAVPIRALSTHRSRPGCTAGSSRSRC